MLRRAGLAAVVLLALAMPSVSAQHEHGAATAVVIAHDANADGVEFVGNLAHFGVLDLGDDVVPDYHQQNHIKVTLNGVPILETTPDSGHDYDGVNMFDVTFPAAGTYTVADYDEAGTMLAMFNGTVMDAPEDPVLRYPTLPLTGPETFTPGVPSTFTFQLLDHGRTLNHTDAWFEVRDASGLQFRTKTHTHTEAMEVSYLYTGNEPSFTVTVTGFIAFPGPGTTLFEPVTSSKLVTIAPGVVGTAFMPGPIVQPDEPQSNAVVQSPAGGLYSLVGTYDPWTTVGPQTQMRLTALAMDPITHHPVPHVNVVATLTQRGTGYTIFTSKTLHEYDGIYEFTAVEPVGEYVLSVDATRGNWSAHIDLPYAVVPPIDAALPGQGTVPLSLASPIEYVDISGLNGHANGIPFKLHLFIHDAAGNPLQHSEVDYAIRNLLSGDNRFITVAAGKLHTHETGTFDVNVSLPSGLYQLLLSPFALEPRPTMTFYGNQCNSGGPGEMCPLQLVIFDVGGGPGYPMAAAPTPPATEDGQAHGSPAPATVFALAAIAVAFAARRR
ncbi:MAG: hypothetical protein V4510_06065 [bacterium]